MTPPGEERWAGREKLLDGERVVEEAARAVLSLPESTGEDSRDLREAIPTLAYLNEPAIDLQPLHFLPAYVGESVDPELLHALAVAGKLDYVRYRWLDGVAERVASEKTLSSSAHRMNVALAGLVRAHYHRALPREAHGPFFETAAALYAGHSLSLALDAAGLRTMRLDLTLENYLDHARARHGPARTSLDAVLLAIAAPAEELRRARASWHHCTLALQLYDDVLDLEEDYEEGKFTWTVVRALRATPGLPRDRPEAERVCKAALCEGVLVEDLARAGAFLRQAADLAEALFPSWVAFQEAGARQINSLKADYEELASEARRST